MSIINWLKKRYPLILVGAINPLITCFKIPLTDILSFIFFIIIWHFLCTCFKNAPLIIRKIKAINTQLQVLANDYIGKFLSILKIARFLK